MVLISILVSFQISQYCNSNSFVASVSSNGGQSWQSCGNPLLLLNEILYIFFITYEHVIMQSIKLLISCKVTYPFPWDFKFLLSNIIRKEIKHHTFDVGIFDPSGAETVMFRENQVNIISVDVTASCVDSSSLAMALSVNNADIFVCHGSKFQQYASCNCQGLMRNVDKSILVLMRKKISTTGVKDFRNSAKISDHNLWWL